MSGAPSSEKTPQLARADEAREHCSPHLRELSSPLAPDPTDQPDEAELALQARANNLRELSSPLAPEQTDQTNQQKNTPDIVFFEPRIPGNTGNAIRLAACVGFSLHLIEPLGFDLDDKKLKRAGLDYHELSSFQTHPDFPAFLETIPESARIFAFTGHTSTGLGDIQFRKDDFLLFGPEPTGLPPEILNHPRITKSVRIPMRPGVRSLNLAVSASIAVYEAWRQLGFAGSM